MSDIKLQLRKLINDAIDHNGNVLVGDNEVSIEFDKHITNEQIDDYLHKIIDVMISLEDERNGEKINVTSDYDLNDVSRTISFKIQADKVGIHEEGGVLSDDAHAIEFGEGGAISEASTLKEYMERLNVFALPEKAQKYIAEDILTDDDINLVGLDDDDVKDLQKIIADNYPLALSSESLPVQEEVKVETPPAQEPEAPTTVAEEITENKIEDAEENLKDTADRLIKQYEISLGQAQRKNDTANIAKITLKLKFLKRALDEVVEEKEHGGGLDPELQRKSMAFSKNLSFIEHLKTKPHSEFSSLRDFLNAAMQLNEGMVSEKDKFDENYIYVKSNGHYYGCFDKNTNTGYLINEVSDAFILPHSYKEGGELKDTKSILGDDYLGTFTLTGNGHRKYNIYHLSGDSDYKQAVKKLFPNMEYAKHKELAESFARIYKDDKSEYNEIVNKEFEKLFGRPYEAADYKVSGIVRDEFSKDVKWNLRVLLNRMLDASVAASLHNAALKKADKVDISSANTLWLKRAEEGGVLTSESI